MTTTTNEQKQHDCPFAAYLDAYERCPCCGNEVAFGAHEDDCALRELEPDEVERLASLVGDDSETINEGGAL